MSAKSVAEEDEEELWGTKEENERPRQWLRTDAVIDQPAVAPHGADIREHSCHPDQQEPEPSRIKEEGQESEITTFPLTFIKSEDDDEEEGDGDCGASQSDSLLAPLSDGDVIASRSSDTNDDEHSKGEESSALSTLCIVGTVRC
ncbi:uncharacterized protein LOC133418058 isoform X2 [Phycodurus eques]|uniref:uncharacterized protein LOC133418058 isoform X2 n=1 Tax=Phycodurus eques TaxID=693459 RepID=UPI002ACDE559|nr:uncharacterized protein LOC133418058 isoform X2 [Phycodurus eques]